MANGNGIDPQKNHIRFIVTCVTILGILCVASGTVLTFKGYNAELLIGGGVGTISGLLGMLSTARPPPSQPDISVTPGPPAKVEVKQPKSSDEPPPQPESI